MWQIGHNKIGYYIWRGYADTRYLNKDLGVVAACPNFYETHEEALETISKFNLTEQKEGTKIMSQSFAVNSINADFAAALVEIATEKGYTVASDAPYSDTRKFMWVGEVGGKPKVGFQANIADAKALSIQEFVDLPKIGTNEVVIDGVKYEVDKVAKVFKFEGYNLKFEDAEAFIRVMNFNPVLINAVAVVDSLVTIKKVAERHAVAFTDGHLTIGCREFTPEQVQMFAKAMS